MLDSDLAEIYGYEVKVLNQQVKRSRWWSKKVTIYLYWARHLLQKRCFIAELQVRMQEERCVLLIRYLIILWFIPLLINYYWNQKRIFKVKKNIEKYDSMQEEMESETNRAMRLIKSFSHIAHLYIYSYCKENCAYFFGETPNILVNVFQEITIITESTACKSKQEICKILDKE